MSSSSGTPLLKLRHFPIDSSVFAVQRGLNPRRLPVSVGHQTDMRPAEAHTPRNSTENVPRELRSVITGIHIVCSEEADTVSPVKRHYRRTYTLSREIKGTYSLIASKGEFASKIKDLKNQQGYSQAALGEKCGVSQAQVSNWIKGVNSPHAKAIKKLIDLAPLSDREWWAHQYALQVGTNLETSADESNVSLGRNLRTIPLGQLHAEVVPEVNIASVEQTLHFPNSWFPEGGRIEAFTVRGQAISPLVSGDYVILVDRSRREEPDLVGCVVAIEQSNHIAVKLLRKVGEKFLLYPFPERDRDLDDAEAFPVSRRGNGRILGEVKRWIGSPPQSKSRKR